MCRGVALFAWGIAATSKKRAIAKQQLFRRVVHPTAGRKTCAALPCLWYATLSEIGFFHDE
jgi:hypothetical protein